MLDFVLSAASRSSTIARVVNLLEQLDDRRSNLLRVLTYHRIDEPNGNPDLDPALISATPAKFERQMSYLASRFRVVSMAELLDARRRRAVLPPRCVMVTVDDGYCDFERYAWPILKKLQLPVTLFVPTAYPDRPDRCFWWDRLYRSMRDAQSPIDIGTPLGRLRARDSRQRERAFQVLKRRIKSLPHREAMACVDCICATLLGAPPTNHVLGWHALRRLASEGVAIAAHSRSHPLMHRISGDEARTEAVESLRDIQREVGLTPPVFAYPGGGVSDAVVQSLADAGFELAFTTVRGINDLDKANPLRLRRINVGARTTEAILGAQLMPWSAPFYRWA